MAGETGAAVANKEADKPGPGGSTPVPVVVAKGDGIGPEIMEATLKILKSAGANLDIHEIEIGKSVYESGQSAGIHPESWDLIRRVGVLLKAPITTPQGKGYKSLNVTLRKTLGLYANVRPCNTYHPFIPTLHPGMDLVIIRENEEDTYGGIEHRQTAEVTQCLKLITRPGSERIVRYAFEYARMHGRKRVTCFVKDNIMKITDGLFHDAFREVAKEYTDIEADSRIIDIGTARVAANPHEFDVIVLPNLYGDIVSDVAAELAGSVGIAGSANIGLKSAMFEAIHGSAPDIAGKGIANPSALLHGAIMMLDYIQMPEVAGLIHNAWLRTIEEGILTGDVAKNGKSVGTREFTEAVIQRLGKQPETLKPAVHKPYHPPQFDMDATTRPEKQLVGVDVFLDWDEAGRDPAALGAILQRLSPDTLKLKMITNRGTKVFPDGHPETFCTDHWRCRFTNPQGAGVKHTDVLELLKRMNDDGLDFIKTEHLYTFDGVRGYSLGQGE